MTPRPWVFAATILAGLSSSVLATMTATAVCPENRVTVNNGSFAVSTFVSTAARFDTAGYNGDGPIFNVGRGHGRYDLTLGDLQADCASPNEGGSGQARVETHDDYVVTGLPPGTPLTFRARFAVQGSGFGYGSFSSYDLAALIREGASNEQGLSRHNQPFQTVLEVTIQKLAGEPFSLGLVIDSHQAAGGTATAQGTLSFVDLPAGSAVTSCQGFYNEGTVPVRSTTWGAVKTLYRR